MGPRTLDPGTYMSIWVNNMAKRPGAWLGIPAKGALPPASMLALHPDVEASAARAVDLEADVRVPCVFQEDEPVFLCSASSALQEVLAMVHSRASSVRAAFVSCLLWMMLRE